MRERRHPETVRKNGVRGRMSRRISLYMQTGSPRGVLRKLPFGLRTAHCLRMTWGRGRGDPHLSLATLDSSSPRRRFLSDCVLRDSSHSFRMTRGRRWTPFYGILRLRLRMTRGVARSPPQSPAVTAPPEGGAFFGLRSSGFFGYAYFVADAPRAALRAIERARGRMTERNGGRMTRGGVGVGRTTEEYRVFPATSSHSQNGTR